MRLKIKWIATMIFACVIMFSLAFAENGESVWAAGKAETLENQSVKVTKVKLNKKNLTINIAGSAKLTAALSPAKAKNRKVTWKSSNKKVATVKNGKVAGISSGTAVITASAGGKKASCKVKVNDAVVSNTVYKMLKGKWDQDGMQGLGITRYAIFTTKYIKWYYDGELVSKYEIVSVVKKSNKKYILKMRSSSGSKFHYVAHVKNGKFYAMDYFTGWSGNNGYSGSGSLHRLNGN